MQYLKNLYICAVLSIKAQILLFISLPNHHLKREKEQNQTYMEYAPWRRLLHSMFGACGELGREYGDGLRHFYYGKDFDSCFMRSITIK